MDQEQLLHRRFFELLSEVGETTDLPNLHILETTPMYPEHTAEHHFRVYHSDGYCIESSNSVVECDPDTDVPTEIYYYFNSDVYEGYRKISCEAAIKMVTDAYNKYLNDK